MRWVELAGTGDDFRLQCRAAGERVPGGGRVLIVADSTNRDLQQQFARHVPGAVTVERVDLPDLTEFADRLDLDADPAYVDLLPSVARFTATLFTGFSDRELLERVRVLGRGTARTPATPVEGAARRFGADPTPHRLLAFLDAVAGAPGVRSHRPQVVAACRKALRLCGQHPDVTFGAAARRVREEHRAGLGALPARAVGSTLLLKGLEADGVVIPDASRMSARHLYVAMTRGSRRLVVCSPTHLLRPMGSRAAARGAA